MSNSKFARQPLAVLIFWSSTIFFYLSANAQSTASKPAKTTAMSWQKVSDRQIARMFLPKEKLYFQPTLEGLPMPDPASLDGVNVYGIKRLVANFDDDPEPEMTVLISYSTGMCTFCVDTVILGILDRRPAQIKIAWRTEEQEAFDNNAANITTSKIVKQGNFYELNCTYDTSPIETGFSRKKMRIIRWNGKQFAEIWSYDLEGRNSGNRGGAIHDYLASVEFLDDKAAKKVKIAGLYTTRPNREEQRVHWKLEEEFSWNETTQKYQSVKQEQVTYVKGQTCVSYRKGAAIDESQCFGETAYQRGSDNLWRGDNKQAISAFSEALETNPQSADVYSKRGKAYASEGLYDRAMTDFNEALKLNPQLADTYLERGSIYRHRGQLDLAISDYTRAVEIDPSSAHAYRSRAWTYARNGQYDEAIADYTRVSGIAPGADNYISRGIVYHAKGDYEQAISDYSQALKIRRDDWTLEYRALAYWSKGQYDNAIADLTTILPQNEWQAAFYQIAEVYYYRGRVYADKGDPQQAVSDFDKAVETLRKAIDEPIGNKIELYFYTAQAYERAGLISKAIAAYKAAIQNSRSTSAPLAENARERIAALQK